MKCNPYFASLGVLQGIAKTDLKDFEYLLRGMTLGKDKEVGVPMPSSGSLTDQCSSTPLCAREGESRWRSIAICVLRQAS